MDLLKCFFAFLICLYSFTNYSQSKLNFDTIYHDFGNINEDVGIVEHTFICVNEGDVPIKIIQVNTSCGCTTSVQSHEKIQPGDSGFVKVQYNPQNRPGKFNKSIYITVSDISKILTLKISGFVQPPLKLTDQEFPVVIGQFRFKKRAINFGEITTQSSVNKVVRIFNYSEDNATLNNKRMIIPDHITLTLTPGKIPPRKEGLLTITYDPIKKNDWGFVSDNITLNNRKNTSISVLATINEYFPNDAKELESVPKLVLDQHIQVFNRVTKGTKVKKNIELKNEGLETLLFRAIKSNCDCLTYEMNANHIKKGESEMLKIFLDTSKLKGEQHKFISVFSNDPITPTQIITIRGYVR